VKEAPMDNTIQYATESFLRDELAKAKLQNTELENKIQKITQRDYATAAILQNTRDGMYDWTMNALEERDISETNAEDIAAICGFELSKEVEVSVTVEYTISLKVPFGEDEESIVNDIDFDNVAYDMERVNYLSSMITDMQIS
jgi:hypothetical protein